MLLVVWLACLVAVITATPSIPPELYSPLITQKLLAVAQNVSNPLQYPEYTTPPPYGDKIGRWQYFPTDTWTNGFFPASLALLAERAQKCPAAQLISSSDAATALSQARTWSAPLVTLETGSDLGHDVGFISFPFQEDLRMNPSNATAQAAADAFAAFLAGRFSSVVGCTRSWDVSTPDYFEVIIDNMINIDIFFLSADSSGNSTAYHEMAISHADKTMQNHVRADGSTFHLVIYNSTDGSVIAQKTAQGYADNSTWTRGQGWAMYGFTSMYNRTGLSRYLDTARHVSQFYVDHLPTGNSVPPWDFDAPTSPTPPRDTSSATLASSAMLLLSRIEASLGNSTGSAYWVDKAVTLLADTVSVAWRTESQWQALLSNGTSSYNKGVYDTGLTYGDYYFIEAGNILLDMGLANCTSNSGAATPTCATGCGSTPEATVSQRTSEAGPRLQISYGLTLPSLASITNVMLLALFSMY
ncbi:hypothetical protein FRB95_000124 [Tulasnella sp. JGI-2019a]|nr:hypothetical protein FRB95_000124 [Tulasnella sp. JGI-2019a]